MRPTHTVFLLNEAADDLFCGIVHKGLRGLSIQSKVSAVEGGSGSSHRHRRDREVPFHANPRELVQN